MVPWWLYGKDLSIARELQHQHIQTSKDRNSLLKSISILTYLGDYDGCEQWLEKVDARRDVIGRQSDYRLRRYRRQANPWQALMEVNRENSLCETIELRLKEGLPVVVDLVGGIGDQIENAALIKSLHTRWLHRSSVSVRPLGENAGIVEQFLRQCEGLNLCEEADPQKHWRITAPWFRYWLGHCGISETIESALRVDPKPTAQTTKLLVCWRTKPDRENPLSSFSRSLPFSEVMSLLRRWQPIAQKKGVSLIDISDYTPYEAEQLRHHANWVDLARQRLHNLEDTCQLMQQSASIATVDTSLGHLAVLCGREVHLLLPLWPDERWYDLLKQGVYQRLAKIHQQQKFHCWEKPLESLSRSLQLID